jgi:hypothetical protein
VINRYTLLSLFINEEQKSVKASVLVATALIFCMLVGLSPAFAYNPVSLPVGYVTSIEASYMPNTIYFKLSSGDATCPAGTALIWQGSADNNKAVFAMLLAAKLAGAGIWSFYTGNGAGTCNVGYMGVQ